MRRCLKRCLQHDFTRTSPLFNHFFKFLESGMEINFNTKMSQYIIYLSCFLAIVCQVNCATKTACTIERVQLRFDLEGVSNDLVSSIPSLCTTEYNFLSGMILSAFKLQINLRRNREEIIVSYHIQKQFDSIYVQ